MGPTQATIPLERAATAAADVQRALADAAQTGASDVTPAHEY